MKTIKLIACDVDGVLVTDTFSPVLYNMVTKAGGQYTREYERNVFSRPRKEGSGYARKKYNLNASDTDLISAYFKEREEYLKTHDHGVIEGVKDFMELVNSLDIRLVCYGGLSEHELFSGFKDYMHYFEQYICTNDFRPGIKEITRDIYGLEFNQVLFIDDVNTVAEVAKANNVPFIGIPANFAWGFQKQEMIDTGVRYILDSVRDIDRALLDRIDYEASIGTVWSNGEQKIPLQL